MQFIGEKNPEIIIDAGHGGIDYGGGTDNGIVEKNMVLSISQYQYKRFKELGIRVALTRDSDKTIDSVTRANLVKNSGAAQCISNHINAASSTADSASGIEVIHSKLSDGKLARMIVDEMSQSGQIKRKTPTFSKTQSDGQDWYFMHRNTGNVSTNIIEYGFATNVKDAERLKQNWKAYAEAVVKAYCSFLGHKYKAPFQQVTAENTTALPQTPKLVEGFVDIANHWAKDSIVKAIKSGFMVGTTSNKWSPDAPLTRAQMAVILGRLGFIDKDK